MPVNRALVGRNDALENSPDSVNPVHTVPAGLSDQSGASGCMDSLMIARECRRSSGKAESGR
jgi:hypothetical protein